MPSSPIVERANLVSFAILSAGKEIPGTYEVLSIRIEQHINRIAEAEIILRDGSPAKQTFEITDSDIFKPGAKIEIKLGYHNRNDSIFQGIVIKQMIRIDGIDTSKLQVVCKDETLKLAINRKSAIFQNVKDSELIGQIAGDYGITADVAETQVQHEEIVQYYATSWDFILNRAEINGLVVVTDGGKLIAAKPAVSDSPALQVQFGYDVIEFDGEIDATYQYSEVQGNAWDISSQRVIDASAEEPAVNEQGDITGPALADVLTAGTNNLRASVPITQDSIQVWADAALLKSRLSRFKGSVTFHGSSKAKVNATIKLMGLSNRFNGNAFISGLTHTVEDGQWRTEVKIGLSAEWFTEKHSVSAPTASGLLPGVKGLQTGIVRQTFEDPDNEFRVQVEIPMLGEEGQAVWARLATFYAGDSIGAYFMPEVNDEVILGFMNDDPRFPIVIGCVYSSSIPAPETPDQENSIKTLITKSNLQLKFDDKNKQITVVTPGGNTMVFSDQDKGITVTDENSNKIQMNNEGVTIESQSNLTLKATREISIQGASIKVNGKESVSIDGSAGCTLSSNGETSVKGSTVMIN